MGMEFYKIIKDVHICKRILKLLKYQYVNINIFEIKELVLFYIKTIIIIFDWIQLSYLLIIKSRLKNLFSFQYVVKKSDKITLGLYPKYSIVLRLYNKMFTLALRVYINDYSYNIFLLINNTFANNQIHSIIA